MQNPVYSTYTGHPETDIKSVSGWKSKQKWQYFFAYIVILYLYTFKEETKMLRERVKKFINEFGIPITVFSKNVNISPASYHKWIRGAFEFSEERAEKISQYLEKYGF